MSKKKTPLNKFDPFTDPNKQSNNQVSPDGKKNGTAPQNNPFRPSILWIILLFTFFFNFLTVSGITNRAVEIEYSQFLELVETDNVSNVVLTDDKVKIELDKDANVTEVKDILRVNDSVDESLSTDQVKKMKLTAAQVNNDPDLVPTLKEHDVSFSQENSRANSSPIMHLMAMWIIPTLIMYTIYYFATKRIKKSGDKLGGSFNPMGSMGNMRKSGAKEYNIEKNTGVSFSDVAGQDEAKESLTEMIDYLKHPESYKEIGAKQPKGALLVGPPGTGKTLLAKAVAGEAGVPFYSISGSEFVEMFVGMGASRVRDLFAQAKKNAPAIIFIDEIDAIGKSRSNQMASNDEREQTLNQLLAEMDGFDSEKGIIVLAATNRPEVLDKALLRPGRFDRRVIVELPDLGGREAILKVHARDVKLADDVDFHGIALATSGSSGADLANMINEAALLAVKEGRQQVEQKDLMESVEVVLAGKEKKDRVMNQQERIRVSYHEVGHALVSALQTHSQPVQKITIVPRTMGSLGYTMNVPEEERYLLTKDELLAQITTLMGGRAAEIVKFGSISTGASNDIERATKLARNMVTQYGMSDTFGPMGLESTQNQYLDGRNVSNVSQETETIVDEEVRKILADAQEQAIQLLQNNTDALERISEYLLEKENITGQEFMDILNQTDSADHF